jgi:AcrR family transcriptional regulator
MPEKEESSEARQRVLDAAERLFAQKGYNAVTVRDIAAEVGIHHTSLYHHIPGGKEELFVEVMVLNLQRHHTGLVDVIAHSAPHVRAQLHAASDWLLSQPPMDIVRLMQSDMLSFTREHAERIEYMAFTSLIEPIASVLTQARQRGEIVHNDPGMIAGGLLGMIESLFSIPESALVQSRKAMAHILIDSWLTGLYAS